MLRLRQWLTLTIPRVLSNAASLYDVAVTAKSLSYILSITVPERLLTPADTKPIRIGGAHATEKELVLQLARTTADRDRIVALIAKKPDWPWVQRQLARHGLTRQAAMQLSDVGAHVPDEVQAFLTQRTRHVIVENMRQTQELLRVLKALEEAGVPAMPFKGPALALWGYGDVSLRRFGDLDILVPYDKVQEARDCLEGSLGYQSYRSFTENDAQEFVDTQMGWEFVREEPRSVVELHWSFFFSIYPFDLRPDDVWERHTRRMVGGQPVRSFDPVDKLLYLCYHGMKHRFASLKWVLDVSQWIRAHPALDWGVVFARARRTRCLRAVYLSRLLVMDLLGGDFPDAVRAKARQDQTAQRLAQQIVDGWLFAEPGEGGTDTLEDILFHVRSCDRPWQAWPFVWHYCRLGLEGLLKRLNAPAN